LMKGAESDPRESGAAGEKPLQCDGAGGERTGLRFGPAAPKRDEARSEMASDIGGAAARFD
jgi:hypothetical protein